MGWAEDYFSGIVSVGKGDFRTGWNQIQMANDLLLAQFRVFNVAFTCALNLSIKSFLKNEKDYSGYRWTVDTPEDLAFVRTIYESFNNDSFIKWKDITKFLEKNPEINQLNEDIEQKALKS